MEAPVGSRSLQQILVQRHLTLLSYLTCRKTARQTLKSFSPTLVTSHSTADLGAVRRGAGLVGCLACRPASHFIFFPGLVSVNPAVTGQVASLYPRV